MSIGHFLKQVAGGAGRTINWLNQNQGAQGVIGSIPGMGVALKAINPLATLAAKAYGDTLPQVNSVGDAAVAAHELYKSGKEAFGDARQLYKRGREAYGKMKTNLKNKDYVAAGRQAYEGGTKAYKKGMAGRNEFKRVRGLI